MPPYHPLLPFSNSRTVTAQPVAQPAHRFLSQGSWDSVPSDICGERRSGQCYGRQEAGHVPLQLRATCSWQLPREPRICCDRDPCCRTPVPHRLQCNGCGLGIEQSGVCRGIHQERQGGWKGQTGGLAFLVVPVGTIQSDGLERGQALAMSIEEAVIGSWKMPNLEPTTHQQGHQCVLAAMVPCILESTSVASASCLFFVSSRSGLETISRRAKKMQQPDMTYAGLSNKWHDGEFDHGPRRIPHHMKLVR